MSVELKGQQIRIRVRSPKYFTKFRTHDVGRTGGLQRIAGLHKITKRWETQSWRLNLDDYEYLADFDRELISLKIPTEQKIQAAKIAKRYWMR